MKFIKLFFNKINNILINIDNYKKLIIYSMMIALILVIGGIVFTLVPVHTRKLVAYSTGWLTLVINLLPLFALPKIFKLFSQIWIKITICSSVILFIMYALWLSINYGSFFPQISATGFNIGEILKGIALFYFIIVSVNLLNKVKILVDRVEGLKTNKNGNSTDGCNNIK